MHTSNHIDRAVDSIPRLDSTSGRSITFCDDRFTTLGIQESKLQYCQREGFILLIDSTRQLTLSEALCFQAIHALPSHDSDCVHGMGSCEPVSNARLPLPGDFNYSWLSASVCPGDVMMSLAPVSNSVCPESRRLIGPSHRTSS